MERLLKKFSSTLQQFVPSVRADDSEEQDPQIILRPTAYLGGGSDEREQTLNQLLVEMDGFEWCFNFSKNFRAQCEKKECSQFFEKLETCNARVRSKKKTSESCHEEMVDFVHCIDHCAAKTLFTKLK